jgi:IS30 family transposase
MVNFERLQPFTDKVKTPAYDNGKEFATQIRIHQALKSFDYFAIPFSSCEHESNEKINRLLRQYALKKRSMDMIDKEKITLIQNRFYNKLMKRLEIKPLQRCSMKH